MGRGTAHTRRGDSWQKAKRLLRRPRKRGTAIEGLFILLYLSARAERYPKARSREGNPWFPSPESPILPPSHLRMRHTRGRNGTYSWWRLCRWVTCSDRGEVVLHGELVGLYGNIKRDGKYLPSISEVFRGSGGLFSKSPPAGCRDSVPAGV